MFDSTINSLLHRNNKNNNNYNHNNIFNVRAVTDLVMFIFDLIFTPLSLVKH